MALRGVARLDGAVPIFDTRVSKVGVGEHELPKSRSRGTAWVSPFREPRIKRTSAQRLDVGPLHA
jgi:hypothetical protein